MASDFRASNERVGEHSPRRVSTPRPERRTMTRSARCDGLPLVTGIALDAPGTRRPRLWKDKFMAGPLRIGVVGCGAISGIYLANLTRRPDAGATVRVVACADLNQHAAETRAAEFGVPRVLSPEALLSDPEVDLVLNLTVPQAHWPIARDAIRAGKHMYSEKPLAIRLADGQAILDAAASAGVVVGAAPDTVLGQGLQTARAVVDAGAIGQPIAGVAFMTCRGHESWHPSPEFYYEPGGGPLFDMGPYYLSALVHLLGPAQRVTGSARASFPTRTITSEPRRGSIIDVKVPTHATAAIEFACGAVVTLIMSFDIHRARLPIIELYGSEGTLSVPDPNTFGGVVERFDPHEKSWVTCPPLATLPAENSRGIGVVEMAESIRAGRPPRASGELALHVLEIMHAVHRSSDVGVHVEIDSTVERPLPLTTPPDGWR